MLPSDHYIKDEVLFRNKIINSLTKLMNINKKIINLKGKTVEKLGIIQSLRAFRRAEVI